jgi:outer membrane protein
MKSSKNIFIIIFLSTFMSALSADILTFSRAYELALENSNELKSSIYMSESDKEKVKQEESQLYPQINLSSGYKKSEYVINPTKNITNQNVMNYSLSLNQSIYDPEIYAKIDAQEARSRYSKTGVAIQKTELAKNLFNPCE